MTIVTLSGVLINYDHIRAIDYNFENDIDEIRAYYANSDDYVVLGRYVGFGLTQAVAVIDEIIIALESGVTVFHMPLSEEIKQLQ